tara:strand:+ start:872 stop:1657 length:786 start_codon:yes stop_codon:yes gene_type:complete
MRKKLEFFLYKIFKGTTNKCGNQIVKHIKSKNKKTKFLSTLNTNSLLLINNDEKFEDALIASNWIIPDGIGAVLACKCLGLKIQQRISGTEIFNELNFKLGKKKNYKYFFFGSTKKNLALITNKMKLDYPNIKIVGYLSPPFKNTFSKTETNKIINFINKKKPDVLWVGLTQPKQEKWAHENLDRLNVKFVGTIGAVFDFFSGQVKRAPKVTQDLGLEWFYRILQDPARLWKRYFFSNLNFICNVLPYIMYIRIKNLFHFK